MTHRLICLAMLMLPVVATGAGERLTIRVSPAFAVAPGNLRILTSVQAHDDNRAIEIVAESADFYRSSERTLDGARAPRTQLFEFRQLPGGAYEIRVTLKGAGGKALAFAQSRVLVHDLRGLVQH
jgi:hypothetical protein